MKRFTTIGSSVYNYLSAFCYMWTADHSLSKSGNFSVQRSSEINGDRIMPRLEVGVAILSIIPE
jgi:hypothetical protein